MIRIEEGAVDQGDGMAVENNVGFSRGEADKGEVPDGSISYQRKEGELLCSIFYVTGYHL